MQAEKSTDNPAHLCRRAGAEYDQEIPQSHTADQPTAPRGKAIDLQ